MSLEQAFEIPVAHIDDGQAVAVLIQALKDIHGPDYDFSLGRWDGDTRLEVPAGRTAYRFIVQAEGAKMALHPGDRVRGGLGAPYREIGEKMGELFNGHAEMVWPGDVVASNDRLGAVELSGAGTYFEVVAQTTAYSVPRLALLRNLDDRPGGCAAYEGAFRREALPPQRPGDGESDLVGVNRVDEHTLDMRFDRHPLPKKHHHGPVPGANGRIYNHSETAIVLPRSVYGLPGVDGEGQAIIFPNMEQGAGDPFTIPLRPGSIAVTPATGERIYGHCFTNAFAMLVAIPCFGGPSRFFE